MATEIRIIAWCDVCLEGGKNTPGETLTVNVTGAPAFDVEVCPTHARGLLEAVAALSAVGRGVGKGVPKTPTAAATSGKRVRKDDEPHPTTCPDCGTAFARLSSLRAHLRKEHNKSLADVGLEAANFVCPDCKSAFGNGQGFAAHRRLIHGAGRKQAS